MAARQRGRPQTDSWSHDFFSGWDHAHATRASAARMMGASPAGGPGTVADISPDLCFLAVKNKALPVKISDRQISFPTDPPADPLAFG